MGISLRHLFAQAVGLLEGCKLSGHVCYHGFKDIVRHVAPAIFLRQCHDAQGQRYPGPDTVLRFEPVKDRRARIVRSLREVEPDEFRRPAADIENEGAIASRVQE